jgi:glycosyltransferase involved in cell wall biosynthesis/fucose 4-O-acetylase-like acetyltransferase
MDRSACLEDRADETVSLVGTDRPVRVCFMIDKLFPAGIELQLLLLIERLDRSKVLPYLCLLDGTDEQSRALEPADCPLIRLGVRHLCRPSTVLAGMRLARWFRRERIDVVHPLFQDSFYFGAPVAKLARVPCLAGFRVDINFWMKPRDRRLGRLLSRLVDGTVANSEACRGAAVADWRVPAESVTIIPNGLDLVRFAVRAEKPLSRNGAAPRVGIVANLRPVKNIELLIRAASRLASSHPHAHFEIAGEGESRGSLEALIESLGLGGRVTLRGTVADVPAFLRTLDVAVLCSLSEGSPNAIMEYMAAGLPAVVTDVGGIAELVEHEVTGLVVPSNDERQLAGAINRLLRDRDLAARLGATARQRAFANYGVETQARRYEAFYRRCLAQKTAGTHPAATGGKADPGGNRVDWVDYAKGIGIFLVVLGHTMYGMMRASIPLPAGSSYALDWMYLFHMPLFFFLSGLFVLPSLQKGIGRFAAHRMGTVLYCYLLWSVLNAVVRSAFSNYTNYKTEWSILEQAWYKPMGELWFLYVLFLCYALYATLYAINTRPWGVLFLGAALLPLAHIIDFGAWEILEKTIFHFFFFALGAWASGLGLPSCRSVALSALLATLCFALFSWIVYCRAYFGLWHVPVALLGISGTVLVANILARWSCCRFIRNMGVLTLQIYLAHTCFSAGWRIMCQKGFGVDASAWYLLGGTAAGVCMPMLLQSVLTRLRFPYLFAFR